MNLPWRLRQAAGDAYVIESAWDVESLLIEAANRIEALEAQLALVRETLEEAMGYDSMAQR